jgi:4,5-DOPA dioxygenase extradiol
LFSLSTFRNEFIKTLSALLSMNSLNDLKNYSDNMGQSQSRMPCFSIGHGSPMNGIEDNEFSATWEKMGKEMALPKAVLCVSAHWYTKGTFVTAMEKPKTIHDFYGFPKALFDVEYPAPGNPVLAKETSALIHKAEVGLDHEWGLDHGTWAVVRRMYPEANIPVLQLSIDYGQGPQYHYDLAKELKTLRGSIVFQ